ncbi:MAG: glycoside hydrolase 5 family protein [Acidobacteriota bacterium]
MFSLYQQGNPESHLDRADAPFVLGVNYWPRRKAMGWWSQFDAVEVREEFAVIRELGLTLVRIFLLWEDFQPAPDRVSSRALEHLGAVCDIAADLQLSLDVTFFTGHMSGPNWAPGWMLDPDKPLPPRVRQLVSNQTAVNCGYLNPFTHPIALHAAELLLKTVVERFRDHPAIALWNLGNEPDLFAWPSGPIGGRSWVRNMTQLIRSSDSSHLVTCGLHVLSLREDNGLRVNDVFAEVDAPVMHGYPMYVEWADGPLDPDFVPFLCALTTALCGNPTLMEEFGGCTVPPGQPSTYWEWTAYGQPRKQFMASEDDFAVYVEHVLPRLVEVGASGALLWCFADYVRELYNRPPCDQSIHERFFGLVRRDGSLKPHGEVVRRFAATRPVMTAATKHVDLDISPEMFYADPLNHAQRLYKTFLGR